MSVALTQAQEEAPWVQIYRPRPQAKFRLFCFPYAGGGPQVFRTWSEFFPDNIEVCPIQMPGRGGRFGEAPFTQWKQAVQEMMKGLSPYWDRPFAFFGHSLGGILAFELARAQGVHSLPPPEELFVSACGAPQRIYRTKYLHRYSDEDLIEEIKRFNGTPKEVLAHEELIKFFLPTLRADLQMIETYQYEEGPALACPIKVFGGQDDPEVGREDLSAWSKQTKNKFSLEFFQGDHFFINSGREDLLKSISKSVMARSEATKS